jgi:hypothetical protein
VQKRYWAGATLDEWRGAPGLRIADGDDVIIERTYLARFEILQLRLVGGPEPVSVIG